jgi:pimeloyl-ACP methyl ester carboxylesterase
MPVSARTTIWIGIVVVLVIAVVVVLAFFRRDMRRGLDRLSAIDSRIARTTFGSVEYLIEGDGPLVLVSHGITGGVDQGQGLASRYLGPGYRLVLPSRFGYLGSSMPADPSPDNQAEAFVQLLNALGIAGVFVLGNSAGGTAALHFAINHPDRCKGLILLSSNVPGDTAALPPKPAIGAVFGSDFLYWAVVRLFSKGMLGMFVPPSILKDLPRRERIALADEVMLGSLPISRRTAGVLFDMFVSNPSISDGLAYDRIASPTLLVHAVDDPAPPIEGARALARSIPGARIMELADGGHLLLGREKEVQRRIREFIAEATR